MAVDEARVRSCGVQLGIDIGTSNTAAALCLPDGTVRSLLFDGGPVLPSAVFLDGDSILVGADAHHAAQSRPEALEPNPKQRVDDGVVLLGDRTVAVERLLAAVLARVREEAERSAGIPPDRVVLTYPVTWGRRRLAVLTSAARLAGLPQPATVYEPVSAAAWFVSRPDVELAQGQLGLVYDLGAGTFDATLIRRTGPGFDVVASHGLPDVGGLDIDATVIASINANLRPEDRRWTGLTHPRTSADFRARRELWNNVRAAKEILSRAASTSVYVPLVDADVPLGREQFEALAYPLLMRTVAAVRAVLSDARRTEADLAAIFLVGGSTRIPLVTTLLHRAFGRPPTGLDQPELVVAYGSVVIDRASPAATATRPVVTGTAVPASPPTSDEAVRSSAAPASIRVDLPAIERRADIRRWVGSRQVSVGLVLVLVVALGMLAVERYRRAAYPDPAASSSRGTPVTSTGPRNAGIASSDPSPTPTPTVALVIPAAFGGRWTGTAAQTGGVVTSWLGIFDLPAGAATGTLNAPTLGCAAELSVVAPSPTDRELHLRQRTTVDPRLRCAAAADILLLANSSGGLDMFWQQFGVPTNTSIATLIRT
jgi:hypothetical protein